MTRGTRIACCLVMDDQVANEIPRKRDELINLMIEVLEEDPNAALLIQDAWRVAAEHVISVRAS